MYKNCSYLLLIILLIGPPVRADEMFRNGEFRPYDEVRRTTDTTGHALTDRVIFFAHFTCPYCRTAHDYLHRWGKDLPAPYKFELVPAVAIPEHYPMAVAYYVVLQKAPERLAQFEQALYAELQDRHGRPMDPNTFRRAAERVGIGEKDFNSTAESKQTRGYVERAYELTELFGIEEVPTVVVANRFRTAPGRVQNDKDSFIAVLNGLISMDYQERKRR